MDESLPGLGDLEREVMQLVWANGSVTAELVRERLIAGSRNRPFAPCCGGWKRRAT